MHLIWDVSAFTRRNDLLRNPLTLLSSQSALEPALGLAPYGLTVPTQLFSVEHRKMEMAATRRGYPSLRLKAGAFRRILVKDGHPEHYR